MDKKTGDLIVKVKNEINKKSSNIVRELISHSETVISMYKGLRETDGVNDKYILSMSTMSRAILDAAVKMMDALNVGTNLVAMGLKDIDFEIDEIDRLQRDMKKSADDIYKDERIEVVDEKDLYKKD